MFPSFFPSFFQPFILFLPPPPPPQHTHTLCLKKCFTFMSCLWNSVPYTKSLKDILCWIIALFEMDLVFKTTLVVKGYPPSLSMTSSVSTDTMVISSSSHYHDSGCGGICGYENDSHYHTPRQPPSCCCHRY